MEFYGGGPGVLLFNFRAEFDCFQVFYHPSLGRIVIDPPDLDEHYRQAEALQEAILSKHGYSTDNEEEEEERDE